ncbi:MAG: hypothetical protein RQ752_16940, partial [Thermohalobaculum sp.]|nr:hypothetical protein [Thermohalobaculum sp.]
MRIAFSLLLLCMIGVAGYFWLAARDPEAQRLAAVQREELLRARAGLRTMLAEHPVYRVADIVITGPLGNGIYDFRGLVAQGASQAPAFGQAVSTCDSGLERPACWTIRHLEIDGTQVRLDEAFTP